MVSGAEVPYFRGSKIKYCETFASRYTFEFLRFFYSSEKQFRKLYFRKDAVFVCLGVVVTAIGKNVLLASSVSRIPHSSFLLS